MQEKAPRLPLTSEEIRAFALAPITRHNYKRNWEYYCGWCLTKGLKPLPARPETLLAFFTFLFKNEYAWSTIKYFKTVIRHEHRAAEIKDNLDNKKVVTRLNGIHSKLSVNDSGIKALRLQPIKEICRKIPSALQGTLAKAIILTSYFAVLSAQSLINLDFADLKFTASGLIVTKGEQLPARIPYGMDANNCPVLALKEWLLKSGITSGPIFRPVTEDGAVIERRLDHQTIGKIIKDLVTVIGLNPKNFAIGSLKKGIVLYLHYSGAPPEWIKLVTGDKTNRAIERQTEGQPQRPEPKLQRAVIGEGMEF